MEGVEAGLRARGVTVSRQHPDRQAMAEAVGDDEGTVVVFDEDELSHHEVARLREGMDRRAGTLVGLNRESCLALRYRVERVVLRGLKDLLPDAFRRPEPVLPR
ncbi:MAG: hypothetical protein ACE5IZ_02545 [Dehalococcoidia bacterium]